MCGTTGTILHLSPLTTPRSALPGHRLKSFPNVDSRLLFSDESDFFSPPILGLAPLPFPLALPVGIPLPLDDPPPPPFAPIPPNAGTGAIPFWFWFWFCFCATTPFVPAALLGLPLRSVALRSARLPGLRSGSSIVDRKMTRLGGGVQVSRPGGLGGLQVGQAGSHASHQKRSANLPIEEKAYQGTGKLWKPPRRVAIVTHLGGAGAGSSSSLMTLGPFVVG